VPQSWSRRWMCSKPFSVNGVCCNFEQRLRAAVADNQQSVVRVGGMAQSREYDAAGGDPRQDQGLDASGAQHQVEIVSAGNKSRD
jgi:hypothetical protein